MNWNFAVAFIIPKFTRSRSQGRHYGTFSFIHFKVPVWKIWKFALNLENFAHILSLNHIMMNLASYLMIENITRGCFWPLNKQKTYKFNNIFAIKKCTETQSMSKCRKFIAKCVFYSVAPEPTFWRAEPSFGIFKNKPNMSLQKFSILNTIF